MAFGIELIRVPEEYVTASFKRVKIDKSAEKASKKERNDTVNPYMRPDQALQSVLYKTAAAVDAATAIINQTSSMVKSIKKGVPTKVASPRVPGAVERLQAQLAELNKKVEMLTGDQRRSPFDGCFTRNPEKSPVQKSATPSVFDRVFNPRDLTEIVKNAGREGFWPLRLTHEPQEKSVVIKSSTLCLGEHATITPLKKSAGPDMDIFASAFPRA